MDLRTLLKILARRWRFATAVLVLGVVVAGAFSQLVTPTYQSQVRVYLSSAQTETSTDAYQLGIYAQQRLASYAELATDPEVLRGAIRRASERMTPRDLAAKVEARAVPNTVILEISVRDADARRAQRLATGEAEEIAALVATLEAPEATSGETDPQRAPIIARIPGDATLDLTPVAPNLPLNLAIGLLLGLVLGIAGAVVRDLLDSSISTSDDLAEVSEGLPALVSMPFDASVAKHPLISDPGSNPERVEVFRVLRSKLQFASLDARRSIVMITSAMPDEGKSLTAANLAISMAQRGQRVLLLDADLRKPRAAALLGFDNAVGLMTVLVGQGTLEECVHAHHAGLDFLGTGPLPPNPAEVLETQAMSDLLTSARHTYDAIVIDAPPLLPVVDPSVLALRVDQIVVVTRVGRTTKRLLASALDRLPDGAASLAGVVLNMVPTSRKRVMRGEGQRYGYGYGSPTPVPLTDRAGGRRAMRDDDRSSNSSPS